MKKKRAVIITPFLSGHGGTETVLSTVLSNTEYLSKFEQINLIILGKSKQNKWIKQLPSNIKIKFSGGIKILSLIIMMKELLLNDYDDVICLSTTIIYFVYKIRFFLKKDFFIISWIHFSLLNENSINLNKLQYADFHLAISSGIKGQMKKLGINKNKIILVFNPVSSKIRTIPISNSAIIKIAFVGRIMLKGQKNLKELFDALNLLKKRSVEIHLYGEGEINKCKSYIKDRNIDQIFYWHGWTNNPWKVMDSMDAVVLTSSYEGFPMVLLEAISFGIPVISSNCPTGPIDIVKIDNGILYDNGNIKELSNDISKIKNLQFNRNNVKKTIEEYYTSNYIPKFWESIYELEQSNDK